MVTERELSLFTRPLKCELNVLSKPNGSAVFSQGNSVMLASLYGPYEVKHQKIQLDKVNFEVIYKSKVGPPSMEDKIVESIVKSACEATLFPRMLSRQELTLMIQEMQDCGSILACAINAGVMAIINSGLDMQCVVAGVCCALDQNGKFVIDPDLQVIQAGKMHLTVAFENVGNKVVSTLMEGHCTPEEYKEATSLCKKAAQHIFSYYKTTVTKYSNSVK